MNIVDIIRTKKPNKIKDAVEEIINNKIHDFIDFSKKDIASTFAESEISESKDEDDEDMEEQFDDEDDDEMDERAKGDLKTRAADGSSRADRAAKSRNKAKGKTAAGNIKKKSNAVKAKKVRRANAAAFKKGAKKAVKTGRKFR